MQYKIGMIVKSKAGRDNNRFYVITDVKDEYVYLADGKLHKLDSPKKKNIKHLAATNSKLELSKISSNSKLRQELWSFNYSDD